MSRRTLTPTLSRMMAWATRKCVLVTTPGDRVSLRDSWHRLRTWVDGLGGLRFCCFCFVSVFYWAGLVLLFLMICLIWFDLILWSIIPYFLFFHFDLKIWFMHWRRWDWWMDVVLVMIDSLDVSWFCYTLHAMLCYASLCLSFYLLSFVRSWNPVCTVRS